MEGGFIDFPILRPPHFVQRKHNPYLDALKQMSIKLLNFPLLIQNEIWKQMSYPDLFLLSLCSSKMHKSIQNVKWNLDEIRYKWKGTEFFIQGLDQNEYVINIVCAPNTMNQKNIIILKFEDMKISCSFSRADSYGKLKISFDEKFRKYIIRSLHNYIISLCKSPPKIYITADLEMNLKHLCDLPRIEGVTFSHLKGNRVEASHIDNYFIKFPNQEHLRITATINGEFHKNSNIFQTQYMVLTDSGWSISSIISNFNGKIATMENAYCNNFVIIRFLTKWILNQAYDNLSTMLITLHISQSFNPEMILREFDTKQWNPLKRPKDFIIDPNFDDDTCDCGKARDIERKSDGKLASIFISQSYFYFFVWNQ